MVSFSSLQLLLPWKKVQSWSSMWGRYIFQLLCLGREKWWKTFQTGEYTVSVCKLLSLSNFKHSCVLEHQILVQPYLLACKGVVPEYPQVPSKENPFNASFHANTHVPSNAYPAASDVILVFHSLYVRHKTGKVCSCCVLALYGARYVLKWTHSSYVSARLCSLDLACL